MPVVKCLNQGEDQLNVNSSEHVPFDIWWSTNAFQTLHGNHIYDCDQESGVNVHCTQIYFWLNCLTNTLQC